MTDLPQLKIDKDGRVIFSSYLQFLSTVTLYCIKMLDNLLKEKEITEK